LANSERSLTASDDELIERAAACVASGGIIGFPTDTVYGIGCSPVHLAAIRKMYAAKKRDAAKPLILLCGDGEGVNAYLAPDAHVARAAARRFLPGPLTLIVPRPILVPREVVAGGDSVGLRVPGDAFCRLLLQRTGPLATTSANLSGGLPYIGVEEVELPAVDFFIERGSTVHGQASSIIDFRTTPPSIVREGALAVETFEAWYTTWLSEQSVQ
jgi:L-threonylcarbamoyladenylate synthase